MAWITTTVVVMMSTVAILVISNDAATIQNIEEFPGSNIVKDMCPPIGLTAAEYQVSAITAIGSDSLEIGGCALIDFKSTEMRKSFSLWVGSLNNGMQRCREKESPFPTSSEYMKGVMYAQLFGRVNDNKDKSSIRCAIHDMVKANATMFRMAVSGDDSCHGLADLLQSNLQTTIPSGAMVLQLHRSRLLSKHVIRAGRSTSDGSVNITNHLSEPRYFYQMG